MMAERLVCPRCGESKKVELDHFLDDDGVPKVRVTCRLIVHEEPVVTVYDDPVFAPVMPKGGGGLVGELDLYSKLESVIAKLEGWVEYGVVEHLFAFDYPQDYRLLWSKFGHISTHGHKEYTLSAYLGLLLRNLEHEGGVLYRDTAGTGRWEYNDHISAWAHPARADGGVVSWSSWASERGVDPYEWPALELLAGDGPIAPEHQVLLIRLTEQYTPGMSPSALYEAVRRWWRLGPRRQHVEHVFAVHGGAVEGCYRVEGWEPAPDTPPGVTPRWGFWGKQDSEMEAQYVGVDVTPYLPLGAQNPVRYVNVPTAVA